MTDRPILFSGPMVRALLDGRKTQTRRMMKPQPAGISSATRFMSASWEIVPESSRCSVDFKAPAYRPGDHLWVREAWRTWTSVDKFSPANLRGGAPDCLGLSPASIWYEATPNVDVGAGPLESEVGRLRAGMHMPRWASRLTLTVTDVRVQRLQEINGADAEAEGVFRHVAEYSLDKVFRGERAATAIAYYRELWDKLNADRGYGWETNPWIVAITFTVERRNIDRASP